MTATMLRPGFDPAPLLDLLVARGHRSIHEQAEAVGESTRQVQRWRAGQRLTTRVADRCALALGMHPCELWKGEW